ncbi:hypothetical protein ACTMU2_21460 [Cupriavidus basilensis]
MNKRFEVYARVANLFDRRYETYGQLANNVFPSGSLVQPHVAPGDSATALFVARERRAALWLGVVYRM